MRHAQEMEHSRQQVAQQLHVHFAGAQQEQRQHQPPSPGLTPQEIRELRQVREYWRGIKAMVEHHPPPTPRRQPFLRPMTEETSFSQTRNPTPRMSSPPRPPRGIRTLVAGRYPEVSMTEEEIQEKLPHSPRTPPHLLPPSLRIQGSPQLRPRHQSTPNAARVQDDGMAAGAARPGELSSVSNIRVLRPLPGNEEPRRVLRPLPGSEESRSRSSPSGTCLLYTSPSPRDS